MINAIIPKLPMRDKAATIEFYVNKLGFDPCGDAYDDYVMLQKNGAEVHFFKFKQLDPKENYGQAYIRTDNIEHIYRLAIDKKLDMPAAGFLQTKPWGQKEFSLLDPDHNLLTFGQHGS